MHEGEANQNESPQLGPKTLRSAFMVLCISLPVLWTAAVNGIVHAVVRPLPVPAVIEKSDLGFISTPASGVSVPDTFRVTGEVAAAGSTREIWIVTEQDGLIWPKVNLGRKGGPFDERYTENADQYFLTILSLDEAGQAVVNEWQAETIRTRRWPGLSVPEDAVAVARIKLRK